ncbi:MAG TPA: sugar transferase [Nocardioidaceae bacterium]|jgi:exopolysaccharide biosynthesis polyprenyl glycosylphosphotransferase|nr:sugar transferase [Nocardioidaceae bacterium]
MHGENSSASRAADVEPLIVPVQRRRPTDVNVMSSALPRAYGPRRGGYPVELGIVLVVDTLVVVALLGVTRSVFSAATVAVAVVTWKLKGLYRPRIGLSLLDDLPMLAIGPVIGMGPALVLTRGWTAVHAGLALGTALILVAGMTVGRGLAYGVIRNLRARGRIVHRTLMVGAGAPATALIQRIQEHPDSGLRLVGTVADRVPRGPSPLPVLGTPRELADVVRRACVSDVIIGYGGTSSVDLLDVIRACDTVDTGIYVVPRLFELDPGRRDDHIFGLPLVRVRGPAHRMLTWRLKRAFDVVVAGLGMLVAAPLFVAVALAVRLELGPGVLFRQVRVGAGGRTFWLLKFRSLPETLPQREQAWSVAADGLGPVGRFIRRYSLDEMPQLLNVLRGDMSLVGPRPERPEYVERFTSTMPWYRHRHRVPSGLTGLAAVNGLRGDTSIEDRARFDNWYIDNWSLWLDAKIMVRTVWSVLTGAGA